MSSTVKRLTIPSTGTLELPLDLLGEFGLEAGDELVVIPSEDGFFVGSREKVMDHLLSSFDRQWQEDDLSVEAFVARRPNFADELLYKHYGLTSADLNK